MALIMLAAIVWRKFSIGGLLHHNNSSILADSDYASAIISYYTAGLSLFNAKEGRLNGQYYSLLMTTQPEEAHADHIIPYTKAGSLIYTLDLPFNTQTHVIGLSKKYQIDRLEFETFLKANDMEKVVLEGDFSDYFDLYASKGQQFEVRLTLDPAAMEFVIDYCRANFWEINGSTLYFVIASDQKGDINLLETSQKFAHEIQPALMPGLPGAAPVHHELPYGEYDGPALKCPVCQKTMVMSDNNSVQACPDGQGILLSGKDLMALRHQEFDFKADPAKATNHGTLTCPNSHDQMVQIDFEDSGVTIDTCSSCPFRWLDADEIAEIASGKKILNPALKP